MFAVYDLPPEILTSLTLKQDIQAASEPTISTKSKDDPTINAESTLDTVTSTLACSLCGLSFSTTFDHRGHLKSDLHNYNLKQKLKGLKAVTEGEFEQLVEHLDESLSGSDSDETEDEEHDRQESTLSALLKRQAKLSDKTGARSDEVGDDEISGKPGAVKHPLIWFSSPVLPENNYFGIYRALFTEEQLKNPEFMQEVMKKQLDPISIPRPGKDGKLPEIAYKGPHIFMCMIGGGHFAAMVVALPPRATKHGSAAMNREATVLAHKTFHRYTTRRKQGGSQASNDNSKGAAHSAGATLRRYNEQALVEDVRSLLKDWKGLLDTSELLFIRATGMTNRRTLFGPYDNQVLRHTDPRIRGFPFTTRRATQSELMRCFIELTRFKIREIVPVAEKSVESSPMPSKPSTPKPSKPKLTEEEQTALLHTSQLQALIRRSKLPGLLSYISNNQISADFEFQPPETNRHAPRPLHMAAAQNSAPLVLGLLTRAAANPTLTNEDGKTAFDVTGDRATRDAFRVARSELGESKWDWEAAKIPPAMTKGEAEKRHESEKQEANQKESDRRKAEEERLRTEGPRVPENQRVGRNQLLAAASVRTAQEKREEEARGLTPEMKMRLERERRARAAEERIKRLQTKS